MLNFPSFFDQSVHSTLRLNPGVNWSYKGQWVQIFDDTEIDRWYVGDFSSASYQITVEYNSNKKEILNALVVARPDEASVVIYGRVSIDDELITLTATVNDSYLSLKASPTIATFDGAKLIFLATYAQTINDLTVPSPLSYDAPQEETPGSGIIGGGGIGGGATYIDDLLDVTILSPVQNQYLKFDGNNWVNSSLILENYAPINNPTFTGTVNGITASMVGLGDVTNESKTAMFTSPTFTGTVTGITAAMVGLGNVANESKATMFSSPTFTGTVTGITASMVGLGSVTNESKATMFSSPTFTGSVSIVGLSVGGSTPVTLISSDSTLAAASNTIISTQSAVKAYVDTAVSGISLNPNNLNLTGTTSIAAVNISGLVTFQELAETVNNKTLATGVVVHDTTTGIIWYHSSISSNFTANFTNLPTTNGRTTTLTLVLDQGVSAYIPTAVQIDGAAQTINWQNNITPSGNASKKDIVSFTLIRNSSTWIVLGSAGTFG
jgi:hypothetical protein